MHYIPICLDICTGPDVVLGGKDKLIVEHPFWFVVETSAGMELDHLVILRCQVVSTAFQMSHLVKQRQL